MSFDQSLILFFIAAGGHHLKILTTFELKILRFLIFFADGGENEEAGIKRMIWLNRKCPAPGNLCR